jgi:hypothetical protein
MLSNVNTGALDVTSMSLKRIRGLHNVKKYIKYNDGS